MPNDDEMVAPERRDHLLKEIRGEETVSTDRNSTEEFRHECD